MKYGLFEINMRPCITPDAVAVAAKAAEEAGFESLWGGEHIVLPEPPVRMPADTPFLDMPITFAFAAAHTKTIRFGSGIILLSQRNPLVIAKQIASVDILSDGRFIFGIGIGSAEQEFTALGVPYADRGKRVEEMLGAMKAIWTMEKPEFHGKYYSFSGVRAEPRPVQKPYPEMVFGGRSAYAFGRTARWGKGWFGYNYDLDETKVSIGELRKACERHNRRFEEIEISITPKDKVTADLARRFADLGVHRIITAPHVGSLQEYLRAISAAERDLIGKV